MKTTERGAHPVGIFAGLSVLLCSSLAAADSFSFIQEGLTRGLDRLREVSAASSIPLDTTATNLPYDVFLSDLDGDGLLDVYVPNHGQVAHRSGLWTNTGNGGFNPNIFTVSLTTPYSAYLGDTGWMFNPVDLNGDGKPDLYFGGWYAYAVACYNRGVSSAGGWTGPRFECRPALYPLAFADVNGDGKLDILTYDSSATFDNYLSALRLLPTVWRLNNGNEDTSTWPVARSEFDLVSTAPAGALLDLDGDGLPDKIQGIAVSSSQRGQYGIGSGGTQVYFGQANGTYALRSTGLESVTSPIAALEDVNGDGCIDIGFDDTSYRDNQYWYLADKLADGRCAGTWHWVGRTSPELPHFMGAFRQSVDLDNSGAPLDVVLVKEGYGNTGGYSGGIHVFRRQADGTWVEVLNHGIDLTDNYYSTVRSGDWNDDGLPDVVAQGDGAMLGTDHGIALFTNQSVNANTWVKVRLPGLSGQFTGMTKIELFEAGQAGNAAARVGQPLTLTTGYHWPSTWYHFGAGARSAVDVRVTFPDGQTAVTTTSTNQRVSISSGSTPPDNQLPTVSLTTPNSGAVLSGTVNVAANAADNVGVSAVQFLLDGAPLGAADSTAPYAVQWDTTKTANGVHTLGASARDAAGNVGTATSVSVTVSNKSVDTIKPTVSITSPPNGGVVSRKSTVTITATASDNVGVASVSFYVGGSLKCTDTAAPYSCVWKLPAGNVGKSYQLQATATDAAGNLGTSSLVTVTVK